VTDGKRTFIGNKTCRLAIKVKAGTTGCNITCPELDEALADATATYKTGVTAADKKGLFEGEQSNPDNSYDDDGNMYQTWYVQISEKNASSQAFNFTLTNQLNSENEYITHFKVSTVDIMLNPLWYVAEYNVNTIKGVNSASTTTFMTRHSLYAESGSPTGHPVFNYNDACRLATDGTSKMDEYHLPTYEEQNSIIPMQMNASVSNTGGTNIFGISNTDATTPYEFLEEPCVIGGMIVKDGTTSNGIKSYMYKNSAGSEAYAVRFTGTDYASAWHYKWVTQTIGSETVTGLLIESYLIDAVDASQAKEALRTLATSTVWESSGYNASSTKANLRPIDADGTDEAYCQRFLPANGYKQGTSGNSTNEIGSYAYSWASTPYDTNSGWTLYASPIYLTRNLRGKNFCWSIRLFHD